jgi:DNA-3-methyladenine glycosylase II
MKSTENRLYITKPDIFSFDECLHFLDRGYDDCLYSIRGKEVIKPLRINGREVLFSVSDAGKSLGIEILIGKGSQKEHDQLGSYVSAWFDLERNLGPFYDLLEQHHQLNGMGKQYFGLRLMGIPDLFEALCWCVIGKQINLTFAHSLKRQLVETYGPFVTYESRRHYLFPVPGILADLEIGDLKAL